MKTLLFCTAYLSNPEKWSNRYHRWIALHEQIPVQRDAIFMFDDASPFWPDDPNIRVIDALPSDLEREGVYFYRFAEHLGRVAVDTFPGWWRGFAFSLDVAERFGFEKIVHIESDACLLSGELVEYINALESGWTALWCPRYQFPEANIQIVCQARFTGFRAATTHAIAAGCRQMPELALPFSHVETGFVGDRYAEYRDDIPAEADYAAQVLPKMTLRYRP